LLYAFANLLVVGFLPKKKKKKQRQRLVKESLYFVSIQSRFVIVDTC
jgi:hypothetical protein